MLELGCEIGNHSWDHTQLTTIDLDSVAKQFSDTDDALTQACGQASTVARAPYGDANTDIYNIANKPFFMWSLDTEDWKLMDADADYNAVMNGDLTDGTIILMHDIHEPSVQAAIRMIPDLIARGYKLVTVSEMAEAKNVILQNACYVDFWPSTLSNGGVPGYQGGADAAASTDSTDGTLIHQILLTETQIILMEVRMEVQMTAVQMETMTTEAAITAMILRKITVTILWITEMTLNIKGQ